MRELLAVELRSNESTNAAARAFVEAWVQKHAEGDRWSEPVETSSLRSEAGHEVFVVEQLDEHDRTRRWRTEIALDIPTAPAFVTLRVRIGASAGGTLAPISYELRTPAIVRTLLRELNVLDAGARCLADPAAEIGLSGVEALVGFLHAERRLPVVVVSRHNASGRTAVDPTELCRELAGLAHVRVLSSTQASYRLTELLGTERSVFGGAVRIYYPGFAPDSEPREHRLFFWDRIDDTLVSRLRSWLGTLSAATTPEHPAYTALRDDRHRRVASADVDELREYATLLEEDNAAERSNTKAERERAALLDQEVGKLRFELERMKESWASVTLSMRQAGSDAEDDGPPRTVVEAMDAVEELANSRYYRSRVTVAEGAIRAGRRFREYAAPGELLRAVHAVLEAGALSYDRVLGMAPMEFFNKRGFGFGAQPSPHLKVDEHTTFDQCLRIYWDVDAETGRWTVTSIGEHD